MVKIGSREHVSSKKTARIAGVLFLMMVVFGLIAEVLFRQKIFSSKDVEILANNILGNMNVYRIGILCDILMALSYLFTALMLYQLLSSVDHKMASVMVVFASLGSVLLLMNMLIEIAPLYIMTNSDYMLGFTDVERQSLAMLFYNLYQHGYVIGQVFFALWVLPLGILIYKSKFIPKFLGILFVLETIFGLLAVVVHFLIPNATLESVLLLPMMVAEFSFMFYLLIKGLNEAKLVEETR